jgi:hypothetical protein
MKHTLKILSIILVGLTTLFSSCESEKYPFPKVDKMTIFNLARTAGPGVLDPSDDPATTNVTFEFQPHEFGGSYPVAKIELWVVKNPTSEEYKFGKLGEVLKPNVKVGETNASITVSAGQILTATQTDSIELGDIYVFYYNLVMESGFVFTGWTKQFGFTSHNNGAFVDIKNPDETQAVFGTVNLVVVCRIPFSDFLGEWIYTSVSGTNLTFFGTGGRLDAVEDPDNPGVGLIMTMRPGSQTNGTRSYWDLPVKISLDFETYTWSWASQIVISSLLGGGEVPTEIRAGTGPINSCENLAFVWTAAVARYMTGVTNSSTVLSASNVHRLAKVYP